MAVPISMAGIMIGIGGLLQCAAGFVKKRNGEEKTPPVLQLTKAPKEKTVKTVT